jgi:hypothetical protein
MKTGELRRVLETVVTVLEGLGIEYHVTGGLASSFYGEPRLTQDVDFVVRLTPSTVARLSAELSRDFFLDPERAALAAASEGMFQALHRELLIKADLHVGEDVPGELVRSRKVEIFEGVTVRLVSKEDAILSKLLWAKQGSSKSRGDVLGMLLDPQPVDEDLLRRLAEELGCAALLDEIRFEIEQ